jgi:hypothetical protein
MRPRRRENEITNPKARMKSKIIYLDGTRIRALSGSINGMDGNGFFVVSAGALTVRLNPQYLLRIEERDSPEPVNVPDS